MSNYLMEIPYIQVGENVEPEISNRPHKALAENISRVYTAFLERTEWIRDVDSVFSFVTTQQFRVNGNRVARYVPGRPLRIWYNTGGTEAYVSNSVIASQYSSVSDSTVVTVSVVNIPESLSFVEHHIVANFIGLITDTGLLEDLVSMVASEATLSEWFVYPEYTYLSETSFSVSGDMSSKFPVNRLVRLLTPTDTALYSSVTGVLFTPETNTTTVTIADAIMENTFSSVSAYLLTPARIEQFLNRSMLIQSILLRATTLENRLDSLSIEDVDLLQSALADINTEIATLNTEIQNINSIVSALDTAVINLSTTVGDHSNSITSLNTSVTALNTSVGNINTTLTSTVAMVSDLETRVENAETTVADMDTRVTGLEEDVDTLYAGTVIIEGAPVLQYTGGLYSIKFAANMTEYVKLADTLLMQVAGEVVVFKPQAIVLDQTDKTIIEFSPEIQLYIKNRFHDRISEGTLLSSFGYLLKYVAQPDYASMVASRESYLRQTLWDAETFLGAAADRDLIEVYTDLTIKDANRILREGANNYRGVFQVMEGSLQAAAVITAMPLPNMIDLKVYQNGIASVSTVTLNLAANINEVVAIASQYIIARTGSTLTKVILEDTIFTAASAIAESSREILTVRIPDSEGTGSTTNFDFQSGYKYSNFVEGAFTGIVYFPSIEARYELQDADIFFVRNTSYEWFCVFSSGEKYFAVPVDLFQAENKRLSADNLVISNLWMCKGNTILEMFAQGVTSVAGDSLEGTDHFIYRGIFASTESSKISFKPAGIWKLKQDLCAMRYLASVSTSANGAISRAFYALQDSGGSNQYLDVVEVVYGSDVDFMEGTGDVLAENIEGIIDNIKDAVSTLETMIEGLAAEDIALTSVDGMTGLVNVQEAIEYLQNNKAPEVHSHDYSDLSGIPQDISPTASPQFYSLALVRDYYTISNGRVITPGVTGRELITLDEVTEMLDTATTGSSASSSSGVFITALSEVGGVRTFTGLPVDWVAIKGSDFSGTVNFITPGADDLILENNVNPSISGMFVSILELKSVGIAIQHRLETADILMENGRIFIRDFFARFDADASVKIHINIENLEG